jgi:hypothetical protein
MANLGLELTTETKEKAKAPLRSIYDISYLKRKFRFEPLFGQHVGPMHLDDVLEISKWTKSHDYLEIYRSNLETTVREISLHGKEVFDEWQPKIIDAYNNTLLYPGTLPDITQSWEIYLREVSS